MYDNDQYNDDDHDEDNDDDDDDDQNDEYGKKWCSVHKKDSMSCKRYPSHVAADALLFWMGAMMIIMIFMK